VLVIPVISVAAERSFSTMRRIKKLTSLPKWKTEELNLLNKYYKKLFYKYILYIWLQSSKYNLKIK
jgi:hypothetical protein